MNKNFKRWSDYKEDMHLNKKRPYCHPREIWWCALGTNVGFEQDGTGRNHDRPFLVIKSFSKEIFWGVALTGKKKEGKYYLYLGKIHDTDSTIILSQIRLLDTKRLIRQIHTIPEPVFQEIKKALHRVLF